MGRSRKRPRHPKPLSRRTARKLDVIQELLDQTDWGEAIHEITQFTTSNPDVIEGWYMAVDYGIATQTHSGYGTPPAIFWNWTRMMTQPCTILP